MSNPSAAAHRAQDDGHGRCVHCPRTVRDYGKGLRHLTGAGARVENEALGLPHLGTPVRVSQPLYDRIAELEGIVAERDRTIERLGREIAFLVRVDSRLLVIEQKLDTLLARPLAIAPVSHRRIADGGQHARQQRRRPA